MSKFIIQTFLFLSPVLLVLGIPSSILWFSGENFRSLSPVLDSKHIIGYAYNEGNYKYLKWLSVAEQDRVDVMALGSSRVLQFRKDMFTREFYNAGFTISGVNGFKPFLQGLPQDKLPEYLIIGLDQWMFNENKDPLSHTPDKNAWSSSFTKAPSFDIYTKVYTDLYQGKYAIGTAFETYEDGISRIGLNARVNNKGFRNDGSIYYGTQIQKLLNNDSTAKDYQYSNTFYRIENNTQRFEYGSEVHQKALVALDSLLEYCSQKEIKVVAFLPPFAEAVLAKMDETGKYGYLKKLYPQIQQVFNKYPFEVFNFISPNSFGAGDDEMVDGFHGGERCYQKILIQMMQHSSILPQICNSEKLRSDLEKSLNRYLVYGY